MCVEASLRASFIIIMQVYYVYCDFFVCQNKPAVLSLLLQSVAFAIRDKEEQKVDWRDDSCKVKCVLIGDFERATQLIKSGREQQN